MAKIEVESNEFDQDVFALLSSDDSCNKWFL